VGAPFAATAALVTFAVTAARAAAVINAATAIPAAFYAVKAISRGRKPALKFSLKRLKRNSTFYATF